MMTQSGVNMMQSVSQRAKSMTKKDVAQAVKARNYQEILAWPATDVFKKWIRQDFMDNIDITVEDVDRSIELFGKPVAILRGKTKRPSPRSHGQGKIDLPIQMY